MLERPGYPIIADIEIEAGIQGKWQKMLDLIADVIRVPVVLIMRVHTKEIEVFVKSRNEENIYRQNEKARLNTGLYCEEVMSTRRMLAVPNALKDERWRNNPDIALGMIAYLGFPIFWPGGEVFGTICVLDTKEREFTDRDVRLIEQFSEILQDDLNAMTDRLRLKRKADEHQKAETELKHSEERFKKIFHSLSAAVVITTADGKIIDANESALTISNVTREQVIGEPWQSLGICVPDDIRQELLSKMQTGRVSNYPLNLNTAAGLNKHLLVSLERISIEGENCLLSMFTDMTSVMQLQQNLQITSERFGLASYAAQLGMWDWDIGDNSIVFDDRVASIYGITRDTLKTTYEAWIERLHPEDAAHTTEEIRTALQSCKPFETEFRIIRQDNEVRYIRCFGNVIQNSDNAAVRMVGINLDITEKHLADTALQKNERRLQHAQAMAHVGNWEIDLKKKQMWASKEAYNIYGIPYENGFIPVETAQRLVIAENRPMMDKALALLIQENVIYDVVFHIRRQKDGELRTLHSIAELERDADNQPSYVIGVVQDITEFSRAQQQLVDSEAKYKAMFNENPAIRLVLDIKDGTIVDLNPAALRFYGYPRTEMIGKSITDLNGQALDTMLENLQLSYQTKRSHYETTHRLSDGSQREVEAFIGPMKISGRQCVNCIIHDITDRKRAERGLAESESRFRMFVESAPDSVFVQTNSRFSYVNRKTLDLFGAESEQELLGKSVPECFAEEENRAKVKERIQRLNEAGEPVPPVEEVILRMDGSSLDVEVSAVPIRYEGQNGALVFMRDIAERRLLENEKREMEMQLQQKQRLEAIGLLAGGVAHEINNPLSGIINYAQLILESPSESIPEYSREIIHEGQRIAEIVRNLLKFSRYEKQSHSLARIEDIVNETLSLIRTIARHDQIALEVNIPAGLPSFKCRSQQIQQVLMNLFTNARDALNLRYPGFHEDKIMRLDCELFRRGERRWIRLTVEDHGVGIPQAIQDKVFDPFFTTKPRGEGTGLGLSISHGIVKDHHGELFFSTKSGQYTLAILELPVDNGWDISEGEKDAKGTDC